MKKIAWGFSVIGLVFLVVGTWLVLVAMQTSFWPQVKGTITEVRIAGRINQAGDALRRYVDYAVEVEYSYLVDGDFYLSDRFSIGTGSTVAGDFVDRSAARTWLKDSPWQEGQPVAVFFDPEQPAHSVLNTGIQWSTWVPLILSLLCGVMAWMCFFLVQAQAPTPNSNHTVSKQAQS